MMRRREDTRRVVETAKNVISPLPRSGPASHATDIPIIIPSGVEHIVRWPLTKSSSHSEGAGRADPPVVSAIIAT